MEIDTTDPDQFIKTAELLEGSFGAINLEDIRAPDCFYIEQKLQEKVNIPVFHNDQHGTAIIVLAGLINACEIQGKDIKSSKIVILGAGASGLATA